MDAATQTEESLLLAPRRARRLAHLEQLARGVRVAGFLLLSVGLAPVILAVSAAIAVWTTPFLPLYVTLFAIATTGALVIGRRGRRTRLRIVAAATAVAIVELVILARSGLKPQPGDVFLVLLPIQVALGAVGAVLWFVAATIQSTNTARVQLSIAALLTASTGVTIHAVMEIATWPRTMSMWGMGLGSRLTTMTYGPSPDLTLSLLVRSGVACVLAACAGAICLAALRDTRRLQRLWGTVSAVALGVPAAATVRVWIAWM